MHHGDLLQRTDYELASVIGVMSVFQKLLQYEMYCADEKPGPVYQADRSKPYTALAGFALYDRAARNERLGGWQGELGVKWAEANAELLGEIGLTSPAVPAPPPFPPGAAHPPAQPPPPSSP
jgi:hypothetical protein